MAGIKDNQLPNSPLGLRGVTPPSVAVLPSSTLHYQYSIIGTPDNPNRPTPSLLDKNGLAEIGTNPGNTYRDIAPEGQGGRV